MKMASCVLFCFLFGAGQFASAAGLPDFNGLWTSVTRPALAEGPQPAVFITQNENTLRIEYRNGDPATVEFLRSINTPAGAQVREFVVDGSERIVNGSYSSSSYSAKWDGEKIVFDGHTKTDTPFGPVEMTTLEEWGLSADGKVLTITSSSQASGRRLILKQVYNKAE